MTENRRQIKDLQTSFLNRRFSQMTLIRDLQTHVLQGLRSLQHSIMKTRIAAECGDSATRRVGQGFIP